MLTTACLNEPGGKTNCLLKLKTLKAVVSFETLVQKQNFFAQACEYSATQQKPLHNVYTRITTLLAARQASISERPFGEG